MVSIIKEIRVEGRIYNRQKLIKQARLYCSGVAALRSEDKKNNRQSQKKFYNTCVTDLTKQIREGQKIL